MVLEVLVWDHAAPLPWASGKPHHGGSVVSQEAQGQEEEDMVSHHLFQELALSDVPQGSTLFNGSPATRGHHLGPVGGYTHERLAVLNEHTVWKAGKGMIIK